MTSSVTEAIALAAWCDEESLWVRLDDGRQLSVPLSWFPRLLRASPEQRNSAQLIGGGRGIHWDEPDEDISVRGLLLGLRDMSRGPQTAPTPR